MIEPSGRDNPFWSLEFEIFLLFGAYFLIFFHKILRIYNLAPNAAAQYNRILYLATKTFYGQAVDVPFLFSL